MMITHDTVRAQAYLGENAGAWQGEIAIQCKGVALEKFLIGRAIDRDRP